jgi:hypothetical protein
VLLGVVGCLRAIYRPFQARRSRWGEDPIYNSFSLCEQDEIVCPAWWLPGLDFRLRLLLTRFIRNPYVTLTSRKTFVFTFHKIAF